ncbi:uncharacterized protein LOC109064856 isoform X2 [Cyprinus carpio]|uniref:Uncharacterized protein LOC109064856 isoform X2 n=1 Tax=Cyprinus carpio TaxID=7962 RepID=A0A9R0A967_CYPCA|nr:uncharacterized protein LOC109064856 isoform X2 [Cyprinus carpio]
MFHFLIHPLLESHSVSFLTLAVMELFIFIVFQLLIEVQSYRFPRVKVSPDVIRESSAVKISCETEPHVTANKCDFYINREEKKMKTSPSCELELTGAEVFRWAAVKSPESLNIICYYTMINVQGSFITSSESDPATVTVLVSTSTTTEKTTSTTIKTPLTVMSTSETTTYSKTNLQFKTNTPNSTAKETMNTLLIVLVSIGVAGSLSGLMGLICLCWFACKKRRKPNKMKSIKTDAPIQETGISCSGSAETHSLITSVPETSQPISAGLEHPESHLDSTADPTKHITSVNVIYQPSDVVINEQQKQGNPEENENVYHLYNTIPENQFTQMQAINPTVW